ncbi:branched-chain amino acid ABC transporter permease [Microbacterium ulmi]|uniref:Branched-chain amino acid ABC transporter permease n=1 Tax=Microbacterium ulmi TaxID=179095 RepID=A0A7Y2Q080_9MICO|nr:branched-chain amino acid ABC transporter permease [Microbacterium ulmi]NII68496.1 branched-chain amino acid transport system permease protein [Microbacterium ulmi]NNH02982.1 branched-chain amino acid ABC transporter permease [Microbacterium ulmi]
MSNRLVETRTVRTLGAPRPGRAQTVNLILLVLLLAAGIALPYLGATSFTVTLSSTILIAAILASSVNFLAGQGGMVSLGHAGIAAASAYGVAWASREGFDPGVQALFALGMTLLVSLAYGLLSMRTSGIYFLMVTLAVGMLVYGLAFRFSSLTGGENGISGIDRPEWMDSYWVYYYVVLGAFVLVTAGLWVVGSSPFGASLRGVRDSESRMRSLGYSVPAYKLGAFMISGAVAGLAGLLAVWNTHFMSPSSAGVDRSVHLIVMVILGGVGTLLGPLIGAAVVVLVENVLSSYVDRWPTILGLIFILVILFARAGIAGSVRKLVNWIRRRATSESRDDPGSPQGTAVSAAVTTHQDGKDLP